MPSHCILLLIKNKFVVKLNVLTSLRRRLKGKVGCNGAIVSMKSLKTILSAAIVFLCWGVNLSAQEKKDDKRWEITGYLGTGGRRSENRYGSTFDVLSFGVGLK